MPSDNMEVSVSSGIRKGQIDWVSSISKPSDFKSWEFRFRAGASVYLSEKVYPDAEERRSAWLFALIRAAQLGAFEEMLQLLELYHNNRVCCENLLEQLGKRFTPAIEVEKKKATKKFMDFERGRKSLLDAVKDLRVTILDCQKYGFNPCDETKLVKYESLLLPSEVPIFKLYIRKEGNSPTSLEEYIKGIEDLAKDQETTCKSNAEESLGGNQLFAGAAFRRNTTKEKKVPKRKGFVNEKTTDTKPDTCTRCGKKCPATKSGDISKCYAYNKECNKCGKKGHFGEVCRSKKIANLASKDTTAPSAF